MFESVLPRRKCDTGSFLFPSNSQLHDHNYSVNSKTHSTQKYVGFFFYVYASCDISLGRCGLASAQSLSSQKCLHIPLLKGGRCLCTYQQNLGFKQTLESRNGTRSGRLRLAKCLLVFNSQTFLLPVSQFPGKLG